LFTNPHERIEQLMMRVEHLETALRAVVAGLLSGEVSVDIALMANAALKGFAPQNKGQQ
jgi:hypothetical protein